MGALEKDTLYSERKSTKAHTVRSSQLIELCISWYRFGNGCNNPVGLILYFAFVCSCVLLKYLTGETEKLKMKNRLEMARKLSLELGPSL